ncbi:MAG: hypothetical protein D4S02_14845 [Rhodocyclaceae bacterium]|nr:MAG: hypothetical protein D4S02_14845 [Rhodocyclaceae bacterium]
MIALVAITIMVAATGGNALAEEHRREDLRHGAERHMVFDGRHGHGHYYPAVGYSISALPAGYIRIAVGRDRFFVHGGVWYRPGRRGYIVVRAPIGISVPILPLGYTTVFAGGVAYYYANDVYYTGNSGNYMVVAPPTNFSEQATAPQSVPPPPSAPVPPASSGVTPPAGSWYYCESAKAYYPYVAECNSGWTVVPATPPK